MARRLLATAALAVLASLAPAAPALGAWTWPLHGEVITPYLNGDDPYAAGQHRGVDIAGPVGAPVIAAAAGLVRFAGTAGSSGLTVSVRTEDGRLDLSYLHLSALAVSAGQRVAMGARIGAVGTTGRRSAVQPHLHFGVRDAGSTHGYHDPLAFLPPPGSPAPRPPRPVAVPAPVALRPAPAPRAPGTAPALRVRPPEPVRSPAPLRSPRLGPVAAPISLVQHHPAQLPDPGRRSALHPSHPRGSEAHPPLGSAPHAEARSAQRAGSPAIPPGGRGNGLDIGWLAACAGALGASLALLTTRGREGWRRSPGGRRRPASSIVLRALLRHHADLLRER
jgi:hypothetical protein